MKLDLRHFCCQTLTPTLRHKDVGLEGVLLPIILMYILTD